jgi:hypothetical protein
MLGWSYIITWRIVIFVESLEVEHAGWLQAHSSWFLLPFYPMVLIGTWRLMQAIRNPTSGVDE